ncbi:MAG: hypothetical protein K6U04_14595 [Armatimonadetes bacterium]|nr:hypothetical protein [Armatimonadota bacterium]
MRWEAFTVVLRLGAPLHVGWRRAGNLWQTRPYILAHQLLAALAARCAGWGVDMDAGAEGGGARNPYLQKREWLEKNLALTCFFPALEPDAAKCHLPFFDDYTGCRWERLQNGKKEKLSPGEFEYLFLDAEMRTALDHRRAAARDGSLYCVEYVRPRPRELPLELRDGGGRGGVYFAGYAFLSEEARGEFRAAREKLGAGSLEEALRRLFDRLQVGGEQKYGWGLLLAEPESISKAEEGRALFGREGGISICLAGGRPRVCLKEGEPVLAPAFPDGKVKGPLEILFFRDTWADGERLHYGRKIGREICCLPGSACREESTFEIGERGLWKRVSGN